MVIAIDLVRVLFVKYHGVGKPTIIPVQRAVVLFRFVSLSFRVTFLRVVIFVAQLIEG